MFFNVEVSNFFLDPFFFKIRIFGIYLSLFLSFPPPSIHFSFSRVCFKMARTMTPCSPSSSDDEGDNPETKTKIDRAGSRVLERVSKQVKGEANSRPEFRKKFFSPRHDVVDQLIKYLEKVSERFPGTPSVSEKYKRFSSEEDVLKDVEYEELTRVGYSGHFAMQLLRDEFPKDFFVLEATEMGPRLLCKRVADPAFESVSSRVRGFFDESPRFLDDSSELKKLTKEYVEKCRECDEVVCKVCKLCG